jgi:hypothetical protein
MVAARERRVKGESTSEKNAAEAALKVWRHPSMKESLLADRSVPNLPAKIDVESRN